MKTVYVCSDSVTGIFSAVYDAWKAGRKEKECGIALKGLAEMELFCDYQEVEETKHKALAVEALIQRHLGQQAYWDIYHALLAADKEKGDAVLGTMLAAKRIPDSRKIMEYLGHPKVEKVFELSRAVGGEAHVLKGFLRFRELSGGILYAQITPKAQVLTCLAPHFADRLPLENWMIHDKSHNMFAVHEAGKKWVLVWDEFLDAKMTCRISKEEEEYARMWKSFCKTIAIESRKNPACQLQHLPLRFRPNMLEFQ